MLQRALPSHTLMFNSVYWYMYCIAFVLVLVSVFILASVLSVFESPPRHSIRMDQNQTYNICPPDLREDALDDMLHRIRLQSDDPDILEQEERDQL